MLLQAFTSCLLALSWKVFDLLALRLAAVSVSMGVFLVGSPVAAPALTRIKLGLHDDYLPFSWCMKGLATETCVLEREVHHLVPARSDLLSHPLLISTVAASDFCRLRIAGAFRQPLE